MSKIKWYILVIFFICLGLVGFLINVAFYVKLGILIVMFATAMFVYARKIAGPNDLVWEYAKEETPADASQVKLKQMEEESAEDEAAKEESTKEAPAKEVPIAKEAVKEKSIEEVSTNIEAVKEGLVYAQNIEAESVQHLNEESVSTQKKASPIVQQTPGQIPMCSFGEYVSPSGGYLNHGNYEVIVGDKASGQRVSKTYAAKSEAGAKEKARLDGYTNILACKVVPFELPTEKQIEDAKSMNARYPEGVTNKDMEFIISKIVNRDEEAPSEQFVAFANEMDVLFSAFTGKRELLTVTIEQLPDMEKAALYGYCIYADMNGIDIYEDNPLDYTNFTKLLNIGNEISFDDELMDALNRRSVEDYLAPEKGTIIYNELERKMKSEGII